MESEDRSQKVSILDMTRGAMPRWRIVGRISLAAFVVFYLASGFYVVQADEQGVVTRFGRLVDDHVMPGIHYHIPWPVEKVTRPKTTEVKVMSVGFRIVDKMRGLPPSKQDTQMLTGDENIIDIQMMIQYRIADPAVFLFRVEDPHWLVRKAAESALMRVIGGMSVDDILTTEKLAIQETVRERTDQILEIYGCGLNVIGAYFQDISPPSEVGYAFRDVASAREDKNRIIHEAQGYSNEALPRARGQADEIIRQAEAYWVERTSQASGEAERFLALLKEYEKQPVVTRTRLYVEAMEEILPKLRKYVIGEEGGRPVANLKMFLPEDSRETRPRIQQTYPE